jgi:hypothetical protein
VPALVRRGPIDELNRGLSEFALRLGVPIQAMEDARRRRTLSSDSRPI